MQKGIWSFMGGILALVLCLPGWAKPKIGLSLDKGGRDDKSFNSAAYRGATETEKQGKIQLKVLESSDDASLEPAIRTFAQHGYDLIIGIGFVQAEPIKKVAKEFPKAKFLIVDAFVDLPNVRSIMFKEHEGAYLVGALAAKTSKSKTVGFVGGMDIPLIRRFELGYRTGAQATDKKIAVHSKYVGSSSDAWRNPSKGKELALGLFNQKADIIFTAAGASALGVFDAVEEKKKLVIGCDSNQNGLKPGFVLTSMLKRVDLAVTDTIDSVLKNSFQAGRNEWGLKEGGLDYVIDSHNRALISPVVEKEINALKKKIIQGKIQIPDYYVMSKKTTAAN